MKTDPRAARFAANNSNERLRFGDRTISDTKTSIATFAAGCFWGVEAAFRKAKGVLATSAGYAGGDVKHPSYEQVCSSSTGHAEAVRIEYDPFKVSYEELLEVFWTIHDPTQLNRQGPDVGNQYRSAIFFHDLEQERAAIKSKKALQRSGKFPRDIVTEIKSAADFYQAEEYHQQYHEKRRKLVSEFL